MPRTLIIGCGHLGDALLPRLRNAGEAVSATTRRRDRFAELAAAGADPVLFDATAPDAGDPLPPAETVIWCVGYDRSAGPTMRAVYVDGLAATLRRLRVAECRRFVYVGSTGIYGVRHGGWVDEDTPPEPEGETARINADAEAAVAEAGRRDGLPAVVVRLAGLYGRGRWPGEAALKAGKPVPGEPDRWLNLIHIEDAASAVLAAARLGVPGRTYLAADDDPLPRGEYYRLLAERLGVPAPVFTGVAQTGPGTGERSDKRVSNRRMKAELGVVLAFPSVRSALASKAP
jgi:nucleoside-diphosphate-sugar epimerase